jgi:hypothetical protein
MSLHTNLEGRLRNTTLPKSSGLLPVFEAVVNSIHSLEEKGNLTSNGEIIITVHRSTQSNLNLNDEKSLGEITGFTISDNGIGFNDQNMNSFETLDSDHKIDKGCRGVGRLLWLKAFETVQVESLFQDIQGNSYKRQFTFDSKNGVRVSESVSSSELQTMAKVALLGFDKTYQTASPKTLETIANSLLEHCLWYFVRDEGAPTLKIVDNVDQININSLYESYMHASAYAETLNIKNQIFELTHIKFRASSARKHSLSLCAANRLVKEENIAGKIPGLYGKITDENGDFVYCCYVSSEYLDNHVRSERTSFDIAEDVNSIFSDTELSLKEIRQAVLERSSQYLNNYLQANMKASAERIDEFVSNQAPRYRPIVSYINHEDLIIDPNISDKDLELHLHKQLAEVERQLLIKGHEIMRPEIQENVDYQVRLNEYLRTAEDIKKSDLASYVSHRRVILDLLERAIQKTDTGKYAKEDLIHQLIMPMRKDSNEVFMDMCNLWLVDERLAFHNYLASDKTLNSIPITGDNSTKEPDICALNVCDNPILVSDKESLPLASITVIEIKRPMRNDAKSGEEKDPIEQALGYLNRIRKGTVNTAKGRLIPNSEDIPGYCYIVCDLTESIIDRCKFFDLIVTSDHLGYFGFHKQFKAYIEVISYDRLVNSAKERNRAFFDKLGLPI